MILSGRCIGQQAEWIKRFNEVYISGTAQAENERDPARPVVDDETVAAMLEGKR